MHSSLIPGIKHELYSQSSEAFSGLQSIKELEGHNNTPLRVFYRGIATGETFISAEDHGKVGAYKQKEYNATFVSADLTRTTKGGGPHGSYLKDNISNHPNTSNASDQMKSLLSILGLSQSKTYLSFSHDCAVTEKIKMGWDPKGKGYGLIIGAYNNIGFRKRTGYVQSVMMTIIYFPALVLIAMKVYPDPKNKNHTKAKYKCLSCDRFDWDDVSCIPSEQEGHNGFKITKEDATMLAREVTLPLIKFVLHLM